MIFSQAFDPHNFKTSHYSIPIEFEVLESTSLMHDLWWGEINGLIQGIWKLPDMCYEVDGPLLLNLTSTI